MGARKRTRAPFPRQPYIPAEDIQICRAWLRLPLTPYGGVCSSWMPVQAYYNSSRPKGSPERSAGSLRNRWTTIYFRCLQFAKCLNNTRSNSTKTNHYSNALDLYTKENSGTPFDLMNCYDFLKGERKWQVFLGKGDRSSLTSKRYKYMRRLDPETVEEREEERETEKDANENTNKNGKDTNKNSKDTDGEEEQDDSDTGSDHDFESDKEEESPSVQSKLLAMERENIKMKRKKMEHEIMKVDVENISNIYRRTYWESKQREIVQPIEKETMRLKREMMEHETMMLDLDTISDPERRRYWKKKQRKIMRQGA